ncbi:Monosaccharide ABC transporter membrane protein, CUT2 family (modular protein) [Modestobacter italicus]|uniref:Monosaccharide ABC transporter membrane protein, CUT2 family (Modular protein) n=1 Tax=Modestobacter italicus (strain DSM 44449 / CECT 9708 / BC 501) TaxID=2732864 RepID=I4EWD5_MODI5|nr:Monosaccharide ABC transporter membrane protein, CUT2 family (modular protein) [Modestobacter marinus]
MSHSTTTTPTGATTGADAPRAGGGGGGGGGLLAGPLGRNLGLIVALVLLCIAGVVSAGDRFADVDNVLTILRLAAVIGVVSVGMTFVIIGGGIDLSVGALVALSSVWASTLATQQMAEDTHWIVMVVTALLVGSIAGLVNGVVIAYGKLVAFIATLAMLAAARGLAEIISNRRTQIVQDQDFIRFFSGDVLGIPTLVIVFALVAVAGWVLLNRTTFGRRTFAVGGNAEAARLAGIRVQRHTVWLYVLSGFTCGIAAVMIMARTTTGSSTHGNLYELDAIAAVVIGGTLLVGGRGTIVGTVLGVLIFTTLGNVFTLNNLSSSAQAVARGVIIVAAVLLQQRLATGGFRMRKPRSLDAAPGGDGTAGGGPLGHRRSLRHRVRRVVRPRRAGREPPRRRRPHPLTWPCPRRGQHDPQSVPGPPGQHQHRPTAWTAQVGSTRGENDDCNAAAPVPAPAVHHRLPGRGDGDGGRLHQQLPGGELLLRRRRQQQRRQLQRRLRRHRHHRLLRAGGRPRLDGRHHQRRQGRGRGVRRRRPAGRRGHQRRQHPDQPGGDLHQRRGRRHRAAALRRCGADPGRAEGDGRRHPGDQRRPPVRQPVRRPLHGAR